jgi:hypothetical protein
MKNSCAHLWVLDCPVEQSHTRVHSYTLSDIYATIVSVMDYTIGRVVQSSISTANGDMGVEMRK